MGRWNISAKLTALTLAGVLASIALVGWVAVTRGSEALLAQEASALEALRLSRQRSVERYFAIIREQLVNFARGEMIVEATAAFATAFPRVPAHDGRDPGSGGTLHAALREYYEAEFRPRLEAAGQAWSGAQDYVPQGGPARVLQTLYLVENPFAVGEKHQLDAATTGSGYDALHARYHPRVRNFLESFGYYDIFLFDLNGNMVYSVFKETDFATNFLTGPYRDTNLAEVYREALEAEPDQVVIRDFEPYEPSYGDPASFIGVPVHSQGWRVGVAIFQMPVDRINQVMGDLAGLGETGESYLLGPDRLMRSAGRFGESNILATQVATDSARLALAGESGTETGLNRRGEPSLLSYGPVDIEGLAWALVSEIDMAEITAPALALRNRIAGLGAIVALSVGVLTLMLLRRVVVRPVERLARGARAVAAGDYSTRVELASGDELGELSRVFDQMTESIDREIQERRQAEAAAAEANRAKSTFLANMSHELRTPMNAILGYSEMLIEDAQATDQADFIEDLEKIHGAGKHLLGLINDVLDLSKVEAGRMDLYLESFAVSGLLDDVAHTVEALVRKNHNRLETSRGPELGGMRADQTKLRQVLFNLVSNAAKFTEEGTIHLRAEREERESEEWLHFSVSDTGIGIAEQHLGTIFDEFAQADASTTREYGGTGLGLAITRRFCEMMGGSVEVQSTLGVGTTFHVRLPAVVVDPNAAVSTGDAGAGVDAAPGSCVLVIDDDPAARELIHRSLSRDGFEVATASSGDEGIELARRLRPVAITLDVMMPGKDGWAVLRELKADAELQSIPVVMVSMVEDRNLGYTLGADEYLSKPIDRGALSRVLGRYRCDDPPCRALVVEDEPHVSELMTRALEKQGWRVDTAENGRVGLERMRAQAPALVFLDLMMPVMDGFEFLREVRSVEEWRGVPIVVVTAKDLDDDDRRRLEGNVQSVLQKGAHDREELAEEIRRLVVSCSR